MITSTTNSTIKTLMKLKQKKYRDEMKAYLVEGDHLVTEALKANQVELLISTKHIDSELEVLEVSEEVMAKLSFTKTPQSLWLSAGCKKKYN